ncbi:hypothetical protein BPA01_27480 [Brevibacillus parabrevis]|uniref:Fe/B12 periplasmic-binding domain-containing protein n=1 Tax=Brevibacillus parabrevis TaxID=54914 RepID=A0A4Y3PP86_BREPA|nr:hypothetical protein BPA01_27480 [Brevibacillus parabrevis]
MIIILNYNDYSYKRRKKIGTVNEMSTLEERMTLFGEVFGMPEQAKEFIAQYETKREESSMKIWG